MRPPRARPHDSLRALRRRAGDQVTPPATATLLFATIAAGGGHVATARAMAEAIEHRYPERFAMRIADFMHEVGATVFDQRHKAMWRWALRYPQSARLGQRVIDALPRMAMRGQRRLLTSFARLAAAHDVARKRPRHASGPSHESSNAQRRTTPSRCAKHVDWP